MKTVINTLVFIITFSSISFGQGCLKGDCENGQGVYQYSDNTVYFGGFVKGLANGFGTCYYPSGQKYVGEWKNHTFHGEGTFNDGNGTIVTGEWTDGKLTRKNTPSQVQNTQKGVTPKVYAVVIGISAYSNLQSLRFTDDDAYKMYGFMKSPEGGAIPNEQISVLIDEDATRNKILETLKSTFSKATEEDMVMVYYSGHGLQDAILPHDYNRGQNKILYKELYEIIENSKAKQKICIMDACYSGGMIAIKGLDAMPTTAKIYYDNLKDKRGGTAIITSSKREEVSIENSGLRQGIFSHYWIKALKGSADEDNDKIVTISEAFNYVQKNVKDYTADNQTPQLDGNFDAALPLAAIR